MGGGGGGEAKEIIKGIKEERTVFFLSGTLQLVNGEGIL